MINNYYDYIISYIDCYIVGIKHCFSLLPSTTDRQRDEMIDVSWYYKIKYITHFYYKTYTTFINDNFLYSALYMVFNLPVMWNIYEIDLWIQKHLVDYYIINIPRL